MSRDKLSVEESRKMALELEILTAKLCQMCADVNHPSADDAVDYLTLAQSAVLKLSKEDRRRDLYRIAYDEAARADYDWLVNEFSKAWE
ncbi:hypothetical protein H6G17_05935 [Chroococcidiopsis sp. FACHB-1243]|uniref:hypothetical protein n=1 Tax=Chroococcidiopsis sp. [FACHB-1243] TaxID=2692781 RepID=UPI001782C4E9|nr:hypothetical protein [Chroococcidiopsis sp. [FACHB-1243]]MBD2305053.1 hypothetical protein [Chroococcidiopsis sp. [FACHB-1243]]